MPILTPQDKEYLENVYTANPYPSKAEYKALAKKLDRHIVVIEHFFEVRQDRYLPPLTRPQQRSRSQPGPRPSRAQPSRRPQRATPSQSQPSQPAQGSVVRSISETIALPLSNQLINVPAETIPFLEFVGQLSNFTETDPQGLNPQVNHQGTPSQPIVTNHQSIGQQSDQQSLEPNSVVSTNQIPNEQEEHSMYPLDLSKSSYI